MVIAFIEYINRFFNPVRDLSAKYAVMQGAMAASERIFQLLDTRELDGEPLLLRAFAMAGEKHEVRILPALHMRQRHAISKIRIG